MANFDTIPLEYEIEVPEGVKAVKVCQPIGINATLTAVRTLPSGAKQRSNLGDPRAQFKATPQLFIVGDELESGVPKKSKLFNKKYEFSLTFVGVNGSIGETSKIYTAFSELKLGNDGSVITIFDDGKLKIPEKGVITFTALKEGKRVDGVAGALYDVKEPSKDFPEGVKKIAVQLDAGGVLTISFKEKPKEGMVVTERAQLVLPSMEPPEEPETGVEEEEEEQEENEDEQMEAIRSIILLDDEIAIAKQNERRAAEDLKNILTEQKHQYARLGIRIEEELNEEEEEDEEKEEENENEENDPPQEASNPLSLRSVDVSKLSAAQANELLRRIEREEGQRAREKEQLRQQLQKRRSQELAKEAARAALQRRMMRERDERFEAEKTAIRKFEQRKATVSPQEARSMEEVQTLERTRRDAEQRLDKKKQKKRELKLKVEKLERQAEKQKKKKAKKKAKKQKQKLLEAIKRGASQEEIERLREKFEKKKEKLEKRRQSAKVAKKGVRRREKKLVEGINSDAASDYFNRCLLSAASIYDVSKLVDYEDTVRIADAVLEWYDSDIASEANMYHIPSKFWVKPNESLEDAAKRTESIGQKAAFKKTAYKKKKAGMRLQKAEKKRGKRQRRLTRAQQKTEKKRRKVSALEQREGQLTEKERSKLARRRTGLQKRESTIEKRRTKLEAAEQKEERRRSRFSSISSPLYEPEWKKNDTGKCIRSPILENITERMTRYDDIGQQQQQQQVVPIPDPRFTTPVPVSDQERQKLLQQLNVVRQQHNFIKLQVSGLSQRLKTEIRQYKVAKSTSDPISNAREKLRILQLRKRLLRKKLEEVKINRRKQRLLIQLFSLPPPTQPPTPQPQPPLFQGGITIPGLGAAQFAANSIENAVVEDDDINDFIYAAICEDSGDDNWRGSDEEALRCVTSYIASSALNNGQTLPIGQRRGGRVRRAFRRLFGRRKREREMDEETFVPPEQQPRPEPLEPPPGFALDEREAEKRRRQREEEEEEEEPFFVVRPKPKPKPTPPIFRPTPRQPEEEPFIPPSQRRQPPFMPTQQQKQPPFGQPAFPEEQRQLQQVPFPKRKPQPFPFKAKPKPQRFPFRRGEEDLVPDDPRTAEMGRLQRKQQQQRQQQELQRGKQQQRRIPAF